VRGSSIEEVLLVIKENSTENLGKIAERLRILPVPVTWIVQGATAQIVRQPWFELGSAVAVEMQRPPHGLGERALKRIVDVIGATLGLIFLLPLLCVAAVALKIDSSGPIIFWQKRRGFNGKEFRIAKFRSMRVLEDGAEIRQATKADRRITSVGKWLRKTSIDELPQLYNVLKGEMSLVGPRPHAAAHDDAFLATVADYAYRNHVKPGITGWAQVHGYRGETPNLESIQRRVEFDRWYINNWTLWLDVSILIRTIGQVIRGRNAY
jgi:putative colanic acid biosynthesis UDP-glucose lipid carrier transferase